MYIRGFFGNAIIHQLQLKVVKLLQPKYLAYLIQSIPRFDKQFWIGEISGR